MALNEEEQTDAVFKSVRTDVDPVSGNEVPPGSLPEEVRDDIPAMLSEGEYVVPADVLRYYGVKFFEDLRTMAKVGLADMEANGRIGGEPIEEQAELPFTDDELLTEEDEMEPEDEQMSAAFGGLVGFAPGGLNMPEGTQVPTSGSLGFAQDPNDPTQVLIGSGITNTGYELVTFYGPGGIDDKVNIPFFNGMAIAPIPPNYTRDLPKETELEKSTSDSRDPVDPALKKKVFDRIEEKEELVNFKNLDSIQSAIGDYHSMSPVKDAFKIGSANPIAGLASYLFGSKSKDEEKDYLLKGINEQLDSPLDPPEKEMLENYKSQLLDRDLYEKSIAEEGEKLGILDSLFSGIKGSLTPENIEKVKAKYNNSASDARQALQDATALKNSLHPSDDPIAYHKAIRAQSEASRAFTALKREETGWGTDDYKPSGAPEPTVFNSSNDEDEEE